MREMRMHKEKVTWLSLYPDQILRLLGLIGTEVVFVDPQSSVLLRHRIHRHDTDRVTAVSEHILPLWIKLLAELNISMCRVRYSIPSYFGMHLADQMFEVLATQQLEKGMQQLFGLYKRPQRWLNTKTSINSYQCYLLAIFKNEAGSIQVVYLL